MRSLIALLVMVSFAILGGCGTAPNPSSSPSISPSVPPAGPSSSTSVTTSAAVAPTTSPSSEPVSPLVVVETRGGECPAGACGSIVQVEADGRLHQLEPTDEILAQVPPELLDALQVEIDQANFALITSRPFTDTCPVAYDGQEVIYTFTVSQGTAFERIASCEVVIDENHPLFRAVAAVMALATR